MAVPKRHTHIPGTYFVTSRTWDSHSFFNVERNCEIFIDSLMHYRADGAYSLHSFVLMPDHFHVLLTPGPETTLERAVQLIKGGSAHRIRTERALNSPVWQRGFSDHRIRDSGDYASHLRYVEENPTRKRLVERASEYRWSSASGYYSMDTVPQGLKPIAVAAASGTA